MELRAYLEILRRRYRLVLVATVVVALVAGISSALKTPMYQATASVLLRPGDAAEQINTTQPVSVPRGVDADRYVAAQLEIADSHAVAVEAAKTLSGVSVKDVEHRVSAGQAGTTDVIDITAEDPDPTRAARLANAVAGAYIENRRSHAVEGLERAAEEVDGKLGELQTRIAELDAEITTDEAAQTKAAAKKKPIRPTPPVVVTPPGQTAPSVPAPLPLETAFTPTEDQALSAARYAAALQYQSLYSRQQELLVNKSLKRGEAELIADARVPEAPASPKPKRDGALGAIVGLLLGLGFAFLREQLDDRVRSREEVEQITGLPVLAELPTDEQSEQDPNYVAAIERPLGALGEAARGLRTSLTFLGVDQPLRRIVVTSSGPGEGKSTVAANLGVVYAQAGLRTILVSADLRRPRLEGIFGLEPCPGLSDAVAARAELPASTNGSFVATPAGADSLASMVRLTAVEGLLVMPCGRIPPNPAELLASARAEEVLTLLGQMADVVIVDTPPVLAVTDAAVLAAKADGVVVVAAADGTHRGALARTKETLAATHGRLLGVVLNRVESHGGSSYYGGYYRKYYGNYYGQTPTKTPRFRLKRKGAAVKEETVKEETVKEVAAR